MKIDHIVTVYYETLLVVGFPTQQTTKYVNLYPIFSHILIILWSRIKYFVSMFEVFNGNNLFIMSLNWLHRIQLWEIILN